MMKITEFVTKDRILLSRSITSKKRALELLSECVATAMPGFTAAGEFDCFVTREQPGSTGVGHGGAIPHSRLENVSRPVAAFLKLQEGVDYDAVDREPVDLLCALLVPEKSTGS